MTIEEALTLQIGDRLVLTPRWDRMVFVLSRLGLWTRSKRLWREGMEEDPVLWVKEVDAKGIIGTFEYHGRVASWDFDDPYQDLYCGEDPGC